MVSQDQSMLSKANQLYSRILDSPNPLETVTILEAQPYKVVESVWHRISQLEGETRTLYNRAEARKFGGDYITTSSGMKFVGVESERIPRPNGKVADLLELYRGLLDTAGSYMHNSGGKA